jgi:hypothetical protein
VSIFFPSQNVVALMVVSLSSAVPAVAALKAHGFDSRIGITCALIQPGWSGTDDVACPEEAHYGARMRYMRNIWRLRSPQNRHSVRASLTCTGREITNSPHPGEARRLPDGVLRHLRRPTHRSTSQTIRPERFARLRARTAGAHIEPRLRAACLPAPRRKLPPVALSQLHSGFRHTPWHALRAHNLPNAWSV